LLITAAHKYALNNEIQSWQCQQMLSKFERKQKSVQGIDNKRTVYRELNTTLGQNKLCPRGLMASKG